MITKHDDPSQRQIILGSVGITNIIKDRATTIGVM